MLRTRVIPCLQLVSESLVKTIQFKNYGYIGDPINTVRIFNELEVDELTFLDIRATLEKRKPNLKILSEITDECFMPLSYGGGITDINFAREILSIGFEKIVINNHLFENPGFVSDLAEKFGSQSVIASIDVKKNAFGKYQVYKNNGTQKTNIEPLEWAITLQNNGAGEILLTSINRDGSWEGFDLNLVKMITSAVRIPVIANGGAGNIDHIVDVVKKAGASAVALGSMVVYQAKGMGVLVNFPDKHKLKDL
jgi:imidazole glycerol-phosphate synthase subunit HisF